jgi:HEAT repeat protein
MRLSRFAVHMSIALTLPTVALAAKPAVLKPKDQAVSTLHNALKSADFSVRGMAYRGAAFDKTNKEVQKQLEDGMLDPQWVVRRGVAEAMYATHNPKWAQIIKEALGLAVLSPYDVLPALDDMADKDVIPLLVAVLSDKESPLVDKVMTSMINRSQPNLAALMVALLNSKDALAQATAVKGVPQLDPVLQPKVLDAVAKAQGGNDEVGKALLNVADRSDESVPVAYLVPIKPKDPVLAARALAIRALHDDRTVAKALLAACQKATGKDQITLLNAFRRVAGKDDIAGLKTILNGAPSPDLLFAVYEILARLGDRSMSQNADQLAKSVDTDVRATGVFYLGWVSGPGRLKEMHEYLDDGIPAVRLAAARVLGSIRSPVSIMPIKEAIEREQNEGVRLELIKSLAAISDKRAYEALMFFTREKDPLVRRTVVRALADSGEAAVRPGLQNALNDNDPRIRAEAVRGFLKNDPAQAVKIWERALKWLPRGEMLELTHELTKTMTDFLEIALFQSGKDDNAIALREEALLGLHLLPEAEGRVLHKVLQTSDDDDLRIRMLTALWAIEGKKVGTEIKSLALSSGPRSRVAAIRMLGKLKGDKEANELLVKFLDDTDERIRVSAALTLLGG